MINPYQKHKPCGVCGKKELVFPCPISLCGDCLKQIRANGGVFKVMARRVIGGFCDIHGRIRFNVSSVNLLICQDCMDIIVRGDKYYRTEKDKYLNRLEKIINPKVHTR